MRTKIEEIQDNRVEEQTESKDETISIDNKTIMLKNSK